MIGQIATVIGAYFIVLCVAAWAVKHTGTDDTKEGAFVVWLLWEFTGFRFIWEKIYPPLENKPAGYRPPATIALWIFGLFSLYMAAYGLASQRYENAVAKIENRMNAFITQLTVVENPEVRKTAFGEIRAIQKMRCPVYPVLYKPSTVFLSLVDDDKYDEAVTVLTRTVERYRHSLKGADLESANLEGAGLWVANLEDADLEGVNLKGARLVGANLKGAALEGANLKGASLVGANLKGADLSIAYLENALLGDANLEGTGLAGANLKGAWLEGANLEGAVLRGANLEGAVLRGTNLEYTVLVGTNLKDAALESANLKGAWLEGANLEGALLGDANLEGASFQMATLSKVRGVTADQLCSTLTLDQATMEPDLEEQVKQSCPDKLEVQNWQFQ
ncbi:MAG: pentapeptide repeat-containing protein [Desulfobacterales bacterium]|jgi:uncharacterized protein YjbI with pentapeptide repeats